MCNERLRNAARWDVALVPSMHARRIEHARMDLRHVNAKSDMQNFACMTRLSFLLMSTQLNLPQLHHNKDECNKCVCILVSVLLG